MDLPAPDLRALATGETVLAFVARGALFEGDEVTLTAGGSRAPEELRPAYRAWAGEPPEGEWTAVVEAVHPVSLMDPVAGAARHILAVIPTDGDVVVLRVFGPDGPVLSDAAYAGRRRSLEGALAG